MNQVSSYGRCNAVCTRLTSSQCHPSGPGAFEIRVHVLGEWRVIYVAKFKNAVYVLHAFHKKTQKTRKEDIELAARRYKQIGAES